MLINVSYCESTDGVRLSIAETGPQSAPAIVFVHGFSQSRLCWRRQFESDLATRFRLIAYDLRGHGMSDKPPAVTDYSGHQVWADDLHAVLDSTGVIQPVVVAWSFGVEVVRDYLRLYGDRSLRGVVLVAGRATPEDIGPGLADEVPGLCSEDVGQNIAATIRFVGNCSATPLPEPDLLEFVGFNCMASLNARIGIRQRSAVQPDELAAVSVPVLIIHGDRDTVIMPTAADRLATHLRNVDIKRYAECGHLPFIEFQDRFNQDLDSFHASLIG